MRKLKKAKSLLLGLDEYATLVTTLEGAKEELEEIERTIDHFVSETPDRILDCLLFLENAVETVDVVEEEPTDE